MDNTVYNEKVYVVRIKATKEKNWDNDDIIYAVAYEGDGGLSFNGLKTICEQNSKWVITKKANTDSEMHCDQSEIETALQEFPATGKQLLTQIYPAATFFELVSLAYQEKIFTDKEGSKKLKDIAKKVKNQKHTSDKITGPHMNAAAMFEKAKIDAENLAKEKMKIDLNEKSKDDLIDLVVDLRASVVAVNEQAAVLISQAATKDSTICDLEKENSELKTQLDEVRSKSTGFMSAADLANLDNKKLSDSLAAEVVSGLKPFLANQFLTLKSSLAPVPTMSEQLGETLDRVKMIDSNILKAGSDVKVQADRLTCILSTNHESSIGFLDEVRDSLGITAEPSAPNIADTLAFLQNAAKQSEGSLHHQEQEQHVSEPAPKHAGNCNYQASGDHKTLVCTLGCGSKVEVAAPPTQNPGSQQANTSLASGAQYATPVQVYTQPQVPINNNYGNNNQGNNNYNRGNYSNRGNFNNRGN